VRRPTGAAGGEERFEGTRVFSVNLRRE